MDADPALSLNAYYHENDRTLWRTLSEKLTKHLSPLPVSFAEKTVPFDNSEKTVSLDTKNQNGGTAYDLVLWTDTLVGSGYRYFRSRKPSIDNSGNPSVINVVLAKVHPPEMVGEIVTADPSEQLHQSEFVPVVEQIISLLKDAVDSDPSNRPSTDEDGLVEEDESECTHPIPESIGVYRIEEELGSGEFGVVYLGHDLNLERKVAIKVPHARRIQSESDIGTYLNEARVIASLEHPRIVPVYAYDQTDDGRCYVVSKYISKVDLRKRLQNESFSFLDSALLIADVADALQFAHERKVVHRDIKPANILLDEENRPYVADFGLAINDDEFGRSSGFVGTPAYTSPEQARGEGHRVDGRSDVFSLGVVLYEMTTGVRPFRSKTIRALLDEICTTDARPPRQVNPQIPGELERICLKAMAIRMLDRYTTALDFANDLREFVDEEKREVDPTSDRELRATSGKTDTRGRSANTFTGNVLSDSSDESLRPNFLPEQESRDGRQSSTRAPGTGSNRVSDRAKVVPKGLRSYGSEDADFFLRLIPGPVDRFGMPESVCAWVRSIESTEPDAFSVGIIHGVSGAGKSSFLKAGLLPNLPPSVTVIYIDAQKGTCSEVRSALSAQFGDTLGNSSLDAAFRKIRQRSIPTQSTKTLLVIDQFERFFVNSDDTDRTELTEALRQCDGQNIQCLLSFRTDFWPAVARFMSELEIPIVEHHNTRMVDMFNKRQAKQILELLGRGHGVLPAEPNAISDGQAHFIQCGVNDLADENGRVIAVQIAMLCEMAKDRDWSPQTIRELKGFKGIAVRFLDDRLGERSLSPVYRKHAAAAQNILRAMLPTESDVVTGHGLSRESLLLASGCGRHTNEFDAAVRILDVDLKLITETEHEPDLPEQGPTNQRTYVLTHDYLVPALRDWLTSKQRETRRGRAQLLLEDRAKAWNRKPQRRFLPSLLECFQITCFTRRQLWTVPQSKMMKHAKRLYGTALSSLAAASLLAFLVWRNSQFVTTERNNLDKLVRATTSEEIDHLGSSLAGNLSESSRTELRNNVAQFGKDPTENHRMRALRSSICLYLDGDDSQLANLQTHLASHRTLPPEVKSLSHILMREEVEADRVVESIQGKQSYGATEFRHVVAMLKDDDETLFSSNVNAKEFLNRLIEELRQDPQHADEWIELIPSKNTDLEEALGSHDWNSIEIGTIPSLLPLLESAPTTLVAILQKVDADRAATMCEWLSQDRQRRQIPEIRAAIKSALESNYDQLERFWEDERDATRIDSELLSQWRNPSRGSAILAAADCYLSHDRMTETCDSRFIRSILTSRPDEWPRYLESANLIDTAPVIFRNKPEVLYKAIVALLTDADNSDQSSDDIQATLLLLSEIDAAPQSAKPLIKKLAGFYRRGPASIQSTVKWLALLKQLPVEFSSDTKKHNVDLLVDEFPNRRSGITRLDFVPIRLPHPEGQTYDIAVATSEMTRGMYEELCSEDGIEIKQGYELTASHPVTRFNINEVIGFLNEMSRKRSLAPAYVEIASGKSTSPRDTFQKLRWKLAGPVVALNGYRLPTLYEAMVFGLGGSAEAWPSLGESNKLRSLSYQEVKDGLIRSLYASQLAPLGDLRRRFEVFGRSALEPVRSKMPNRFGLFDCISNCSELTQSDYGISSYRLRRIPNRISAIASRSNTIYTNDFIFENDPGYWATEKGRPSARSITVNRETNEAVLFTWTARYSDASHQPLDVGSNYPKEAFESQGFRVVRSLMEPKPQ